VSDTHYELSPDLQDIAERLYARYGNHLGHVNLSDIVFLKKWGRRPKKSQVGEISIVKGYAKTLLEEYGQNFCFEFSVWADAWDQLDPSIQQLLVFHGLYSVTPGASKLRQPDVQEHGPIASYFGVYWRREKVVESLLDGPAALPIPLPPDPEPDEGQTSEFDPLY
jgi:hypothetical protein